MNDTQRNTTYGTPAEQGKRAGKAENVTRERMTRQRPGAWMRRTTKISELGQCWIDNAREEARRLAAGADIAEYLHDRDFEIARIDAEGVLVRLQTRKIAGHEVEIALAERPDLPYGLVYTDGYQTDCIRVDIKGDDGA